MASKQEHHALRNKEDYTLPNPTIDQLKRIPLYSLPAEWNSLGNLKFHGNLITFKCALKNSIFEELNAEIVPDQ